MNAPERLPLPTPGGLDVQALSRHVDASWSAALLPELIDYIAVPAKSPMFDPDWAAHGHLER
ncbi:MAG TPA: peptidase M20, partial [Myxococcota bacterium]|nr:peptidase M20 [Myxococcota bacterium]